MTNEARNRALNEFPVLTAGAGALCVASFVGISLQGENAQWNAVAIYGHLPPDAVWTGKPWALIASSFVHVDFLHLAFNVYWLWTLGGILERLAGPVRWLAFFLGAAWVSAAAQLATGNAGVGMSGVGYALFGFAWVARERVPAFKEVLSPQTVGLFVLWFFGCYVATLLGLANIANEAHLGGAVFGALVGAAWVQAKRTKAASVVGVLALSAASFVPLFWCPLSPTWTSEQAIQAQARGDLNSAVRWLERSLQRGQDPAWTWSALAEAHALRGDQANYARALRELREVDEESARAIEDNYGLPEG